MNGPHLPTRFANWPGAVWQRTYSTAIALWTRVINIGNRDDLSLWEQKRVRLLNGMAAFSLAVFPLFMLRVAFTADYVTFWLCFFIICMNSVVILLNYYRLHTVAAYYFVFAGMLFYSFNTLAKKNDGTEYALLVNAITGMLFFRNYRIYAFVFLANVGAFALVKQLTKVIPPFLYIPGMADVYVQNVGTILLALFWVVFYFKTENLRQEGVLEKQNDQLQQTLTELHVAQAQLIQHEKLASLGELTAGIAHEIQNPLNFVNNFAELAGELLAELADEHARSPVAIPDLQVELLTDAQQTVGKIQAHGQRATAIVRGMLEHSRSGAGRRELTDLNALCTEYLHLSFNGFLVKERAFRPCYRTDLDPALLPRHLVAQDLGRVLLNLCNNAFYAVWHHQQRIPTYQPDVWVRTRQLSAGIEIRVGDNGPGIDGTVLPKIFQPFFTTKPTGSGTGLGLSLSYEIITKGYGGTLAVQTTPGAGTEFVIVLPG